MSSNLIIIIICAYVFLIFFLSRLFVPHLGFRRSKLPDKIPMSMEKTINKLKNKSKSKKEFLKNSFDLITKKYFGNRIHTFLNLYLLWEPIDYIWKKEGFVHCTWIAYVIRIFLVRSGFFKEEDIKVRHTFMNFDIHQYLEIRVNDKWIPVDGWAKHYNVSFGERPPYFL